MNLERRFLTQNISNKKKSLSLANTLFFAIELNSFSWYLYKFIISHSIYLGSVGTVESVWSFSVHEKDIIVEYFACDTPDSNENVRNFNINIRWYKFNVRVRRSDGRFLILINSFIHIYTLSLNNLISNYSIDLLTIHSICCVICAILFSWFIGIPPNITLIFSVVVC